MQDSMQLPQDNNYHHHQSQQQHTSHHNTLQIINPSLMMTSIISPKNNRRLAHSYNTASQQSLAYSNSTYHNKLTQRSPPLFNLQYLNMNNNISNMNSNSNNNSNNDQNVNTMNYSAFNMNNNGDGINNKGQLMSTFGSNNNNNTNNLPRGMAIRFDRITQQSGIQSQGNSFFMNNNNNKSMSGIMSNDYNQNNNNDRDSAYNKQQVIELPYFLSLQNSPDNIKIQTSQYNDSYDDNNDRSDQKQKYTRHNKYYNYDNQDNNNEQQEQLQIVNVREVFQQDSLTIPMKKVNNYKKINPTAKFIKMQQNQQQFIGTTRRGEQRVYENNKNINRKQSNSHSNNNSIKKQTSLIKNISPNKQSIKSPKQTSNKKQTKLQKQPVQIKQQIVLKQRVKQLQYELRSSQIQREQLRTRVNILNQLLQDKFLENNSIYINNKQQLHKTINQLIQTKTLQKQIQQLNIENIKIKQQLEKYTTISHERRNSHKQTYLLQQQHQKEIGVQANKSMSLIIDQNNQTNKGYQQKLTIQKQHQLTELKLTLKQQNIINKQNLQSILLLEQKQKRFQQQQRPKLLKQINSLLEKINQQKQTIEKLQMENNLINCINLREDNDNQWISSPQGKRSIHLSNRKVMLTKSPLQQYQQDTDKNNQQREINSPQISSSQKLSQKIQLNINKSLQYQKPSSSPNTHSPQLPDTVSLLMLQQHQLKTLKKQRDYFHAQYQSLKSLEQINYKLILKIQDMENQLSSIRQLIEVDDEITF